MLTNANFSVEEWERAPQYQPEGSTSELIPLDFVALNQMAYQEGEKGTFQSSEESVLATMPFYLGHLPAAFYKLEAPQPEFMAEHQALGNETIVILRGVMKVVHDGYGLIRMRERDGLLYLGQTLNIRDSKINMEAVGVFNPAECLALAVFHDAEIELGTPGLPILRAKQIPKPL